MGNSHRIKEYMMAGDGIQAPGAIVLRHFPGNHRPYVVHFYNQQDGGYYYGDYCTTLDEANVAFTVKCKRYDPAGRLHKHYLKFGFEVVALPE